MATNRYFDSLRGDTTEDILEQYNYDPKLTEFRENVPAITPDPRQMPFYEAAGFQKDPNNPNNVITPSRQLGNYLDQREIERQKALAKQYAETKGSALFRVGDTLADAGRLFLSPLFWLSGEDTSKYDPSAVVDAGYKQKMEQSENLRVGLLEKLYTARDARMLTMQALQKDALANRKTIKELNTPMGTPMKELLAYLQAKTGNPNVQLPTGFNDLQALQQEKNLQEGKAISLIGASGNSFIFNEKEIPFAEKIGTNFVQQTKPHIEAFAALKKLQSSLTSDNAIAQVAAITQFNKILDPASVVRESEVALIQNARSLLGQIEGFLNRAESGKGLGTDQIRQLGEAGEKLEAIYRSEYEVVRKDAEKKLANMGKGDPVIYDHFLGVDFSQQRQSTTPSNVVITPEVVPSSSLSDGSGNLLRTDVVVEDAIDPAQKLLLDFDKFMQMDFDSQIGDQN